LAPSPLRAVFSVFAVFVRIAHSSRGSVIVVIATVIVVFIRSGVSWIVISGRLIRRGAIGRRIVRSGIRRRISWSVTRRIASGITWFRVIRSCVRRIRFSTVIFADSTVSPFGTTLAIVAVSTRFAGIARNECSVGVIVGFGVGGRVGSLGGVSRSAVRRGLRVGRRHRV
jgi:hypothetical protein